MASEWSDISGILVPARYLRKGYVCRIVQNSRQLDRFSTIVPFRPEYLRVVNGNRSMSEIGEGLL
jgi:hypothetical protein